MVSNVTLGNFFTVNGKNVLGGAGGSGLDTQSIINALVEAKQAPGVLLQNQITQNDAIGSALTTFQSLLAALQTSVNGLRNAPGLSSQGDTFDNNFTSVSSNTSVAGSNYANVTATSASNQQSYTISQIQSLAQAEVQTTGNLALATEDSTSAVAASGTPFKPGTFVFNGQSITLTAGQSLDDVATTFNQYSTTTGVTASVVKVSTGNYKIQFTATNSGTANHFDLSTTNSYSQLSDASGVLTGAGIVHTPTVAATDAIFTLNGTQFTRSTNSISDVVSGITFNLTQATPDGTTLTVSIQPDTSGATTAINNFVTAYNNFKQFAAEQTKLASDGTYDKTAVLANDLTFRNVVSQITNQVGDLVSDPLNTGVTNLSDIGITFGTQAATSTEPEVDNILQVNTAQLSSALSSNYAGVRNLFEFTFDSDNSKLAVYQRTNALGTNQFILNIAPTTGANGTYTATYLNSDGSTNSVALDATVFSGGILLKGQDGTVLEGLQLLYSSPSAAEVQSTGTLNVSSTIAVRDTSDTGTGALATVTGTPTALGTHILNVTQAGVKGSLVSGDISGYTAADGDTFNVTIGSNPPVAVTLAAGDTGATIATKIQTAIGATGTASYNSTTGQLSIVGANYGDSVSASGANVSSVKLDAPDGVTSTAGATYTYSLDGGTAITGNTTGTTSFDGLSVTLGGVATTDIISTSVEGSTSAVAASGTPFKPGTFTIGSTAATRSASDTGTGALSTETGSPTATGTHTVAVTQAGVKGSLLSGNISSYTAAAGDTFNVTIGSNSPVAVTLAAGDTGATIATKIQTAIGATGTASYNSTTGQLSIVGANYGDSVSASGANVASVKLDGADGATTTAGATFSYSVDGGATVTGNTTGTTTVNGLTVTLGGVGSTDFTTSGQAITLTAGESLDDVANSFNQYSTTTGITATVVQTAAGQYKINFTATKTGAAGQFDLSTANTYGQLIDPSGVLTGAGIITTPTTAALDPVAATIDVTANQGLADKIYNVASQTLTQNTGSLALDVAAIAKNDTVLNDQITALNTQVAQYQTELLQKFSSLETAISSVNTLLESLNAQDIAKQASAN